MTAALKNSEMQEIIDGFCQESLDLFDELEEILEVLEDNPSNRSHLEKFGQIIDRVMGAAKSIQADEIATFCELGKVIGYKSSQTSEIALLEVVVAVLFDSLELLRKMVEGLQKNGNAILKDLNTKAFVTRLHWLSDKFKDIERASCSVESKKMPEQLDQKGIDDLIASLGL